jgi:glyoxylase-like metal-dependent hydrolase (beta-lactamase superfamily II)
MAPAAKGKEESIDGISRKLGEARLTIITDRTYFLDGGAAFGVVPKTLWSRQAPADELNRVRCSLNSLIVELHGRLIVIETGCGNKLDEKQIANAGLDPRRDYLERFAAAGFRPGSVNLVVNSHLHYDHCGWNTVRGADGHVVATFPEATYHVQRDEWEHARLQHERDRVSYLTDNYDPLVASGQMRLLTGDGELLPGVSVMRLAGHTRGMQAILVRSGGETACYVSDLMPTHWHLKPTWLMAFDLYPLETIANKHRILEQAARERWLIVFTHDPEHAWGYVELSGGHYVFVPA